MTATLAEVVLRRLRAVVGARHGMLVVAAPVREVNGKKLLGVECDCGKRKVLDVSLWGLATSCGCQMLVTRPKLRADCVGGVRPCPWMSCSEHLYIDVLEEGVLVLNAEIRRPEERGKAIVSKPWAEDLFLDQLEDAIDYWFDEVENPRPSCTLDEADRVGEEGMQLDEIAEKMFVTRERVRQVEAEALEALRWIKDFAHLNPTDTEAPSHEHVRYACKECDATIAECPCEVAEKRAESSFRACEACKRRRTHKREDEARQDFTALLRARADAGGWTPS